MNTDIWKQGRFTQIKPNDSVDTTKNVHAFCVANGMRDSLFKSQGGWYWLSKSGELNLIARTLYLISFESLYNLKDK